MVVLNIFCAVSNGGQTWSSSNVQAFTLGFMDMHNVLPINAIAHGGNTFIAGASSIIARRAAASGAGNSQLGGAINAIAYGNGNFVAGAANGVMSYSRDNGATWTQIGSAAANSLDRSTFAFNQAIHGIAHGSGRFIAVGANGKMSIGVHD